jgi:hypothetical protein
MSTPLGDAFVANRVTRSSDRSGAPDTRLRGRRLILARAVWVAAVTLIVAPFLATLPAYYTLLQTICTGATCSLGQPTPGSALAIQKLGFSVGTYATFTLALTLASAFLCFTLGAVIFWRRSDDWMALLGALGVVALGTVNVSSVLQTSHSTWRALAIVMNVFGYGVFFLVCSLFPNGRFVPRWTRWLLPCWVASGMVFLIFRNVSFAYLVQNLVWLSVVILLLIALFYRYHFASSPLQRQQTKWVISGLCVAGIISVGLIVPTLLFSSLGQAGSLYQLILQPAEIVVVLIVPISIGLVIALQSLVHLLTGTLSEQPLIIVASTLAIAALFQPLCRRIQRMIDRRFYRRKYDAVKTLAAFSATLRNEVDLNRLSEQLLTVVEETMQPAHVSLWLCAPKRSSEQTTRTLPIIDTVGKA